MGYPICIWNEPSLHGTKCAYKPYRVSSPMIKLILIIETIAIKQFQKLLSSYNTIILILQPIGIIFKKCIGSLHFYWALNL